MKESEGFFQANDTADGIEIRIAPDGRPRRLRVLPIGADRNPLSRLWSWIRRRPQYSAAWFLKRLESSRPGDLVEAIESFWIAVDEPELRYLTPEETLDAIAQFFRGGSLDERATRTDTEPLSEANEAVELNWTALYAEFCATYGVPDPSMPWVRFLVLCRELEGQEARERLRLMDSAYWGTARAFPNPSGVGSLDHDREQLQKRGDVVSRPKGSGLVLKQQGR